ncbi:MAG TPA: YdeI/OmpD-associated family protein [Bryobacteraceae bacterium]|nr:YdeI/OmpD-associated family protein [Bryobacteraceae bacterium]
MKKYRFKAKIEAGDGGGAYVLFPYDVEKEFGTRGRVPVKATFNGVPYAGSLIKYGAPQHMLPMLKAIREQSGKDVGDTVEIEVWKDEEERTLEVPAEVKAAMKKAGVIASFERLSYTHRKEYCRWIAEAKKEETRARRLEKAIQMLKDGVKTPG